MAQTPGTVDITIEDLSVVLQNNPLFRAEATNVALVRELTALRVKLANTESALADIETQLEKYVDAPLENR